MMKTKNNINSVGARRRRQGSTLFVVMSFVGLLGTLSGVMLIAASTHYRIATRQVDLEQALYIAEAGAEQAAQYIVEQDGYIFAQYDMTRSESGGSFQVSIIPQPTWRTHRVVSVGTFNGQTRQVNIEHVFLPTYARYALWSDQNGSIYFTPGEEFTGHVHANDKMWFSSSATDGGATFWDEASSGASNYGGNNDYVNFHKGFELNAAEGSMADVDFIRMQTLAGTYGLVLEGNTNIEFDGTDILVTNERRGWTDQRITMNPNQLIYVKDSTTGTSGTQAGKLTLKGGDLDGRLTLVSDSDTLIKGHVRYTNDPRTDSSSNNALGIISRDDVWIDPSAPDNLDLHAAIMATGQAGDGNGSFGVLNYNQNSPRGSINLLGSIVQDTRGAVGTFSSSGPTHGYYKNYAFDGRFAMNAPPFYPVVDQKIQFAGWSEGP